jgi:hypothetical protein
MDRPFACREIQDNRQHAERENRDATLHVSLRDICAAWEMFWCFQYALQGKTLADQRKTPDRICVRYSAASLTVG